mgnify:CR=1 FL=1
MHLRRAITVISASVLCGACVPLPHNVTRTPQLSGKITASGTPVVGASLFVTNSYRANSCGEASSVGKTNADGNFMLAQQNDFHWFYAPLVVPVSVSVFVLCIGDSGAQVLGYRGVTFQNSSQPLSLECDLHKPYILKGGDGFEGIAVCRLEGNTAL